MAMDDSTASNSLFSRTSTSSQAISDGFSSYQHDELDPYIRADLRDSESCDVDQLLAVFVERCRVTNPPTNPTTPLIVQAASNSQNWSPASSQATERPPGSSPSAPDQGTPIHFPPVSRELLGSCLQKTLSICNDDGIKDLVTNYQRAVKEVARYEPFVEFANYLLNLVKSYEFPGLRESSPMEVLFQVSDKKALSGTNDVSRYPDIVLVSLASAKRVRPDSEAVNVNWETCVQDGDLQGRHQFNWADVFACAEMKWYRRTLGFDQPESYTTTELQCHIESLPTREEDSGFATIMSLNSAPMIRSNSNYSTSSTPAVPHPNCDPATPFAGTARTESAIFNTQKRRAEHDSSAELAPRKRRRNETNNNIKDHIMIGLSQSGIRAAEMLRCSLGRKHAFGIIIIDAIVWIWWFDRQGALQSTGINFIKDLPRFLMLLVCLQRFTLADWGFDKQLDPSVISRHSSRASPDPQPVELEVDGKNGKFRVKFSSDMPTFLHQVFCLKGKFTRVFDVTSDLDNSPPLVAKLYWPNQNRPHEADIVNHAREESDLQDYLPDIFGWDDIDPIGTRRIREELGINANSPRPPRLLRILVSEKLSPVIDRRGNDLVLAWVQCIRCHYRLWERHIRHLDISLGNIMIRHRIVEGEDHYFGVLNDWDLGEDEHLDQQPESRQDLTKTILFTSLDLLESKPTDGRVVQRYSHDLESCLWVLLWVFLAVRDQQVQPITEVQQWQTSDINVSKTLRKAFVLTPHSYAPHLEWMPQWTMGRRLARWLRLRLQDEITDDNEPSDENEPSDNNEPSDENETERKELLSSLLEIVKRTHGAHMPSSPQIQGL